MKNRICFIICILMFFISNSKAQNNDNLLKVEMTGYMIYLSGSLVFQPCTSETAGILKSFDRRSFLIHCSDFIGLDCKLFANLGDSLEVNYKWKSFNDHMYSDTLKYFFCSVKMALAVFGCNDGDFVKYQEGRISIDYNGRICEMDYNFIRQRIYEVVPQRITFKNEMRQRYNTAKIIIPDWLSIAP